MMKRFDARTRNTALILGFVSLFFSFSSPAQLSLKSQLNIGGTASDAIGNPIVGPKDYRIRFFDAATGGAQLGSDVIGSVTLSAGGIFNIPLESPADVATLDNVWYELALDTEEDGIDADDVFGQRLPVYGVPYAHNASLLNGQPSGYYLEAGNLTGTVPSGALNLTDADVPDDITIDLANQALSATDAALLNGQPGSFYLDAGNLTGTVPSSVLSLTDADVPDGITIELAGQAVSATQALSAMDAALLNGQPGSYYLDAGNLTGTVPSSVLSLTDADVPDGITIELANQAVNATQALSATDAALLSGQPGSYYLDAGNLTGTVPSSVLSLTDADVPDDITIDEAANALQLGGAPAIDYALNSAMAVALAGKAEATHTHDLGDLSTETLQLSDLASVPSSTEDLLYQYGDYLYWQGRQLSPEWLDVDVAPNVSGDYRILADTIIQGSLGVGFDAVAGMSFSFDTIVLRENNLRILFDDTSVSAGFPYYDWRLKANDSASGGKNYFGIEDVTTGTMPFWIGKAAPTDSLMVHEDNGFVGVNTRVPGGLLEVCTDPITLTDAQQISTGDTVAGAVIAQSFVPSVTGTLDRVEVNLASFDSSVTSLTFMLYSSEPPDPVNQILTMAIESPHTGVLAIDLSRLASPITLGAGNTYIFQIYSNLSMTFHAAGDLYPGGQAYYKTNFFDAAYTPEPGKDLWFKTYITDPSASTSALIVDATGKVGIGNPAPVADLDVAGSIAGTTVNVGSLLHLTPVASAPASPAQGDVYYDSTLNVLRVYDGASWRSLW